MKADPTHIHQIIMNLTTNAYHAMEETGGELIISLKPAVLTSAQLCSPEMSPGEYACLSVSDKGTGIDIHLMNKIFDPFFTTKKTGKGTGMGLSVVHGIICSLNGGIKIQSIPGQGSTFHVYIPVATEDIPDLPKADPGPVKNGNERILIIDDDRQIIAMEKTTLKRFGYRITAFTDCMEAIAHFNRHPDDFDLIITDFAMPGMSGKEVVSQILSKRPGMPVIMATGYSEKMTEETAAQYGIRKLLIKPVRVKDLARTIREVLDENLPA